MKVPQACLCCQAESVGVLVNFGPQPPSNRFERSESPSGETHPLVVGQCTACGLFQLIDPMQPAMVKSHFDWMSYNEPEGHLDDLVARLRALPGLDCGSRIVGLTYKDDSTLARFQRLGYSNTYRIEAAADLGLNDPCAGLESVQAVLDPVSATGLTARHGLADLLLVRHVLEHAHEPTAFLKAVSMLVKPGGYLVFEVPDCAKFIQACDYSFIWEEHITYLCAQTLEKLLAKAQLGLQETVVYPYPLEDALISIARNDPSASLETPQRDGLDSLLADGLLFARRYPELCAQLQALLGGWRQAGKKVAIFGAGHLAAKFANMFSLGPLIDCVIDDNPNKQDLLMPGSRLAIRGSAELESRGIGLCLLSLNPESEQKVLAKHQPFLERGGQFLSIFALSPKAVYAASAL